MTVVSSPVIQLDAAKHVVELKEPRNERAADVTRKCKLQASFYCSTNVGYLF